MANPALEQVAEDKAYWQELATALGWKLIGFTYHWHTTYVNNITHGSDESCHLSGKQRDDIMRALAAAKGE